MTTLLAFDTSYLYFRAFFGVPTTMTSPDGRPVNAVRGTLDSIARLVEQYSPDLVACAWDDDWRPEWRTELVPSYKAHRVVAEVPVGVDVEETPDELAHQVPVIRDTLTALGVAVIGAPAHEADDVLGSLASQHAGRTLVVTGDRDLFQLVDDDTSVVYVGQGVAKHALVDDAWLQAKYGLTGSRYSDFAVLRGDPSDGLPGVRGIGDKSAARLVAAFPSLEALVETALAGGPGLTPAVRASVAESAEYIIRAQAVVDVVRSLPLPAATPLPAEPDREALAAIDARWDLGGSLGRALAALTDE